VIKAGEGDFSIFRTGKLRETKCDDFKHPEQLFDSYPMSSTSSLAEQIFGSSPKPLHLGISVSNLEESVKWYSENLGFALTKRLDLPEVQFRVAILEYQGFGVELIEVKGSSKYPLAWKEPGPQHKIQGIVHFAFRVNDLDATEKVLRDKGAASPVSRRSWRDSESAIFTSSIMTEIWSSSVRVSNEPS
jgi:methylmalonyl-CoA/ethylmalonyl-CoA epimerase